MVARLGSESLPNSRNMSRVVVAEEEMGLGCRARGVGGAAHTVL